jgi:Cu(I)/Ag(I) efflux system membrane protein CusA/SilA
MGRILQVPGWSNIFTQPIINRIEMLSTGVRTDIGVKVFGPDLSTIERVCQEVEAALKPLNGARDVVAAPFMGKGYLEVTIDRQKAARYGVSVTDVQDTIEVALGGRVVTQTVEERYRIPVRIRYARANREDEEAVKNLLVTGSGSTNVSPAMGAAADSMGSPASVPQASGATMGGAAVSAPLRI